MALHTPESLVSRSDSKNPATTCKGMTTSGRPCRRALSSGVVAVHQTRGALDGAAYFCWQHKEQAEALVAAANEKSSTMSTEKLRPLQTKSSIDSLVARFGLASIQDTPQDAIPPRTPTATTRHNPRRRRGFWSSLCCIGEYDDEYEIVRRRSPAPRPMEKVSSHSYVSSIMSAKSPVSTPTSTPLVPPFLSPKTAAALQAELAKPTSPYDEAGYIYIFWLTDDDDAEPAMRLQPSARAALLQSPTRHAPPSPGSTTRTIKLKIGRANNVHRRMNEWTRQCGYKLSLVRWYPYLSDRDVNVRKVPLAHRVERLIHLELADMRVMRDCARCGRQHREWFEVDATEGGVKAVDGVVRKWVEWAERRRGS